MGLGTILIKKKDYPWCKFTIVQQKIKLNRQFLEYLPSESCGDCSSGLSPFLPGAYVTKEEKYVALKVWNFIQPFFFFLSIFL